MAGILTIGKDSDDRAGPTCPVVVKGQTVRNLPVTSLRQLVSPTLTPGGLQEASVASVTSKTL